MAHNILTLSLPEEGSLLSARLWLLKEAENPFLLMYKSEVKVTVNSLPLEMILLAELPTKLAIIEECSLLSPSKIFTWSQHSSS